MVEENAKNTSYRFVLEPAISDDGSCHSWELLTKDIIAPARNNASAPAFSFSTLTESDKLALFTRQIELLSVFDFSLVDNKPISLNIDDLLSHFILTDRYLCDFLRSCKHIALEINENFHEFIAGHLRIFHLCTTQGDSVATSLTPDVKLGIQSSLKST